MPTVDNFVFVAYAEYFSIILVFGYAAYWAFTIRRALATRLYRNLAFGTGLVASVMVTAIGVVSADVTGVQSVITPFALLAVLTTFYFIDSSVLAARRSDPLLRDTLHWTKVRYPYWVLIIILALAAAAVSILFPAALHYNSLVFVLFSGIPYLAALGVGLVVLPLSAVRSRDGTLRTHFKWFGLYVVFFFAFVITVSPVPPINFTQSGFTAFTIVDFQAAFASMLAAGYSLYQSAKSLAPLNRLVLEISSP